MANTISTNRSAARHLREDQRTIPITSRFHGMSNHARLSDHANGRMSLAGRAKWFLPVLAAMLMLAAMPNVGLADSMTFAAGWGEGNGTIGCDGECCALYELTITSTNVSELDITLGGGTGSDDCFDKTCFATQSGFLNGVPMSSGAVTFDWTGTPGILKITFSPALAYPDLFEFWICKSSTDTCRTNLNWETKDNLGVPDSYGHDTILTGCDSYSAPCGDGCDLAWQSGTNSICVELGASANAHCITLNFELPIACLPTSIGPVTVFNCDNPGATGGITSSVPPYPSPGPYTSFTWCAGTTPFGGCTFPQCTPICFTFGDCQTFQLNHVYVTTDVEDEPCAPSIAVFKALPPGGGQPSGQNTGGQNFPNPVDASSGFNTTIPFTTTAEGTASIRIVDAKGNVILNDDEEATYAGTHFFYFSAKDLPSGTYYYTIEFPQGVVIASKMLLVVR